MTCQIVSPETLSDKACKNVATETVPPILCPPPFYILIGVKSYQLVHASNPTFVFSVRDLYSTVKVLGSRPGYSIAAVIADPKPFLATSLNLRIVA